MKTRHQLNDTARHLRYDRVTPAEERLWTRIRRSRLGVKFRRQAPLPKTQCIADFWCPALRLAIELDGEGHDAERDWRRDRFLANRQITVLRFPNETATGDIVAKIEAWMETNKPQDADWKAKIRARAVEAALAFRAEKYGRTIEQQREFEQTQMRLRFQKPAQPAKKELAATSNYPLDPTKKGQTA